MRDSQDKAKAFALKLLSYRQRSEAEIRDRLLRKGFSLEIIEDLLKELKASGLIDDKEAAKSFFRVAKESRLLGGRAIKEYLLIRGINPELIDEVTEGLDEMESATMIVKKWLRKQRIDDPVSEERFKKFMLRKGYSMETINSLIKQLKEEVR
ncbi:MAG: regulatory protein RecX [Thermodesulfovibrionales bacterium]